jgi:hypothetical protein
MLVPALARQTERLQPLMVAVDDACQESGILRRVLERVLKPGDGRLFYMDAL